MFPSRLPLLFAFLVLFAASGSAANLSPANPNLNPRARAILEYFQQLQAGSDLRLISGQFAGWSGSSAKMEVLGKIHQLTGRWPAMIGLDYCGWDEGAAAIHIDPVNKLARDYWRNGGLVNISWHAPNPANPKGGGLNDKGVKLSDLLTPGNETHERWMKSLDRIAAGLEELQQAGVVVIWRPLHEMNGHWFWWGAHEPADFIAVWRHMFDYFTQRKKLHNLIWAYGPNHGDKTGDYYPGDAYADLVGIDAYTDHIDPTRIKGYPEVAALGKPVGFTEYGPHGAQNPPGDYDFRRLLDGIAKHFPAMRHFLTWDQKWNPAENKFAREFYTDPRVITRETLPAGLAGN